MYLTSEFDPMLGPESPVEAAFFSKLQTLPIVITAKSDNTELCSWLSKYRDVILNMKLKYGAVLFRNFKITDTELFKASMESLQLQVLSDYGERQIKRADVDKGVFTSTSHPKEGSIFLHNEQSFNHVFPQNILFNCHIAAASGGCTPLADTRRIFQRIPEKIREKFVQLGYRYVRNFMENIYVDWQWAFQTDSKARVEQYCLDNDIFFEWHDSGGISLKTWQTRPVAAYHPVTKDPCWFNHCLAFNVNNLDQMSQHFITSSFSIEDYPYHTFFGDGEEISTEIIEVLRQAYLAEQVTFEWQSGDLLLVDNISVSHGRESYEGDRRVLTAMTDPCLWANVQYSL